MYLLFYKTPKVQKEPIFPVSVLNWSKLLVPRATKPAEDILQA